MLQNVVEAVDVDLLVRLLGVIVEQVDLRLRALVSKIEAPAGRPVTGIDRGGVVPWRALRDRMDVG